MKFSKKIVLKSFTVILLSFVLTVSILAPSMISLINTPSYSLVENSNEEEKDTNEENEKEEIDNEENEESEEDKKEFFLSSLINSNFYNTTSVIVVCLVETTSSFALEIQLPPPEYNI